MNEALRPGMFRVNVHGSMFDGDASRLAETLARMVNPSLDAIAKREPPIYSREWDKRHRLACAASKAWRAYRDALKKGDVLMAHAKRIQCSYWERQLDKAQA